MFINGRKLVATGVLALAILIGVGSLACFMVFLYSGSLNWVNLGLNEAQGMVVNSLLSLAFFLQHSGMVRRGFRYRLARLVPMPYQGALYTIASGLVLFLLLAFWQESGTVLLEVQGWPGWLMRGLFFLAAAGTGWGMWALRSVDMFGLDAVVKQHRNEAAVAKSFSVRGPYRWVRHPLYLFTILIIWSNPEITSDRLLFNVLWTLWVIVGAKLEERELVADFGDDYRAYRSSVPMLVPRGLRPIFPAR